MAGGKTTQDDDEIISGINVTPLVDVMLVLLIVFMVTAKIIVSQGMPMDLPQAASGEEVQTVFSVDLDANGETRVDSKVVPSDESVLALAKQAKGENSDVRAVIRADKSISHGRFVHVMDLLKQAGIVKIAIGVEPQAGEPDSTPSP